MSHALSFMALTTGAVPLADARRLQTALRHGELLVVDGDHDLRASLQPHTDQLVAFLGRHLRTAAR